MANLDEIRIAHTLIKGKGQKKSTINHIDEKYATLKNKVTTLKPTDKEYEMCKKYLNMTVAGGTI